MLLLEKMGLILVCYKVRDFCISNDGNETWFEQSHHLQGDVLGTLKTNEQKSEL